MTTYQDLVDVMRRIQERTGDPQAWMAGLTPTEVTTALMPATPVSQLDPILTKIRRNHPDLYPPPAPGAPPVRTEGDAAEAIARAETALAHQNSVTSQLDLQVISAVLNAHLKSVEGGSQLAKLQQELETAVAMRSDLDTPAGARDFQRFLISKLRDIRDVVASASLDDTSKATLMAAWTSLYNASKNGTNGTGAASGQPPTSVPTPAGRSAGQTPAPGTDSLLDSLLLDDPGLSGGALPEPATPAAPAAASVAPSGGGGATLPAGGMPGLGMPSGLPLPSLLGGASGRDAGGFGGGSLPGDGLGDLKDDPDHHDFEEDTNKRDRHDDADDIDEQHEPASGQPESPPSGPTTVTLPNGETVTAASPQLAAAIKAAAGGTPIAEAFQQQGITLPSPGTAVAHPVDPAQVVPGDIGMFTDRHALALGRSKALLEGQIQHISAVSGPSFLGWEHPPSPAVRPAAPAPDTPTPTRPSATLT
ncbi:DUF4226 domain-containing protein [Mycobacterium asiaticum]|uniref:Biofilm regulator BssS n=1 Tax=Mycobacterium asiaticum TaxID=1790 RepID=A0A1A3MNW9_MYCAS|nr:DUF4226 domain-containing protein [Mycobacterium asiaticum]OBK10750.1 hypothetical protein A5636_14860 [Mycobacterium asiaticum]